jgi:hypothetical protein
MNSINSFRHNCCTKSGETLQATTFYYAKDSASIGSLQGGLD